MGSFDDYLNRGVALMETLAGDRFTHNGRQYVGNFRTGNSLEQAEAGEEMRSHGYLSQVLVILHVSRAQFESHPTTWKRQKLHRLTPAPAEYTVLSVNIDDPNVYAIVLLGRQ